MADNNKAGQQAVQQNIRALVRFLQDYAPFSDMDESHLARFVEDCSLRYYGDGEVVLEPGGESVTELYVVKQGQIRGERDTNQDGQTDTTFAIGEGECFPMAALLGERPTRTRHLAVGDTFCLVLPRDRFVGLFRLSEPFRDFCLRGVSSLLDQVNRQAQSRSMESLGNQHPLDTPLSRFAARSPVTCSVETSIRQAVARMHQENVGSIIITDHDRQPRGIFTLRDLRALIAAESHDLDNPIARAMTPDPHTLPESASAFDAGLAMAEHHFAHICLVDEQNHLTGVVSERDLFALQRVDLVQLMRTISSARRLETLVALRSQVSTLIEAMLARGARADQTLRIITTLNDATVRRVIELNLAGRSDTPAFTWLTFGSEARHEQTLLTDQDNGILFQCDGHESADEIRQRLLPLARQINQDLARCGFTLCKGKIMAGEPDLCLSADEWLERYRGLLASSTPGNLLKSAIFFDLRPVWGPADAVEAMFEPIREEARKNSLFQKMMAGNALHQRPPLHLFRSFTLARGEDRYMLDLKTQGLSPFVDAARVFALAHRIRATATLDRIEALTEQGVFEKADANAWVEAYGLIQLMRMEHHQRQFQDEQPLTNRIDITTLNPLDRRILREALRQAQRLQHKLERAYPG